MKSNSEAQLGMEVKVADFGLSFQLDASAGETHASQVFQVSLESRPPFCSFVLLIINLLPNVALSRTFLLHA